MSAYTTIKGANTELGGMGRMVKALKTAFPNLSSTIISTKNAFVEATTKGEKFKSVLAGIKSGIEGMSTGGKIALFAIAIGIFTKVMQYIMDASNRAEEETTKTAEKSKQAVSELEQQQKSLKDLVSQYKTLAEKSKTDLSVRAELKSVQEQINKLVGGEVDGLDLVNGKLDEQLEKIREKARLEAEDNNDVYAKATQDAIKSAENTTMYDGRGFDMEKTIRVKFVDVSDEDGDNNPVTLVSNAFTKALEDAGIKADISMPEGNGDSSSFTLPDNVVERYEAVKQIVQWLKENGYTATDVWEKFIDAETRLKKAIDGVRDSTTEEANNVLLGSNNMPSNVDDLDDYVKMRDKLIEEVKQSPGVADALDKGFVDEEWINNTVDNYLGGLEQYADVYNQWWNKFGSDAAKGIEKLKEQYKDADFSKWVDSLSVDDRDLVYNISLNTDTAEWQLDDWKKKLSEAKSGAEKAASKLPSIFSSKDSDNDKTFSDRIKTYRENINSLTEALEKYKKGELDEDTYHGLVEKFPQLAGRTKDLDVAITELMDDMDSDMVSDFDDQFGKLETQEDIDALKEYESQVLSTRETAAKFQSDIENLVSVFGTVKSAVEEYNENGFLSLSSLQSILSLNDKYISALTNEHGALDLSTESYKKLVEAELIELKAQTLQNSLDTVRNIDNRTEALAYLNEREHSAAQASLDLADAQWQEALSAAAVKDIQQGTGDLYQRTVIAAREAYDTRIALIDEYAKTAFTIGELSTATDEYSKALNNEKEALENSKKALEDQKNALEETKQGYEDALSAVKDLVSWVQDYIKQIKNDEIDAIQKKKDAVDELIDAQKELLDAEKAEHDWNKTVKEKQNNIASNALSEAITSLDDSSAGRKAHKEATDSLSKSREDWIDTLYDHRIDERKNSLDKLKEEQDEYYDNLIQEIQDYLSNEVQLYKDACSMIDNDSGDLYGKLLWYCRNYTTTTEAEFNHMWNSAQSAMEKYNVASIGTMQFMDELKGRMYEVDDAIDTISKNIETYENRISDVKTQLDNLKDAAVEAKNAIDAANSTPLKPSTEARKFEVSATYRGVTYSQIANTADEATISVARRILQAKNVSPGNASRELARIIDAIRESIRTKRSSYGIEGGFRSYASGTNYAAGGLSLVGERGAEFKVLNTGDGIVKNQIVKGITALGTNPAQFIADAGKLLMKNLFGGALSRSVEAIRSNNQIAPSIHINVQGDATQATVKAITAVANDIVNKATKNVMNLAVRNKRII